MRMREGFRQTRLKLTIVAAGAAGLLVATGAAFGFGTFEAPETYGVGVQAYPVRIADFNHDGKRDVVVGNEADNNVSVLLGRGTGRLRPAVEYPAGDYPFGIAVGDFDRNGDRDLAVVDQQSDRVSILFGNGDGSFDPPVPHVVGDDPYYVATGKFNGDNRLDLAVANHGAGTDGSVSILLGQPGGDFAGSVDYPAPPDPTSVAVADFNRNGKQDVIALTYDGPYRLLMGRGDGTFRDAVGFQTGTDSGEGLVVADFNHDHRADLAANNCTGETSTSKVFVRLGRSDGTFRSVRDYKGGSCSYQPDVADVNRDGNPDLLESNEILGTLDVLRGNSDGTFKRVRRFPATPDSDNYSVAAGRLNADRGPDLAVPDYNNPEVAILINEP